MPHCEFCNANPPAVELHVDEPSNKIACAKCKPEVVKTTFIDREFDYALSYSKTDGVKASARLGKATLQLHIPQEEITKVLG